MARRFLAILRILVGLLLLNLAFKKWRDPDFFQLAGFAKEVARHGAPFPFYGEFLTGFIFPHARLFAIVSALGEWFDGVTRADLRRQDAAPSAPPKRLTDEMVRAERIASLKRRDPVLSAAIDALDLDVAD